VELTILLIATDEAPMLRASLPAALAQEGVEAEVVVVDNGSADETAALVADHPPARRLALPRSSYAEAYNMAVRAGTAEAVLFLNADCFLEQGFCRTALDALRGPRVGAVQGKLLRTLGPAASDRLEEVDSVGLVLDRRHRNTIAGHGAPSASYAARGPVFGPDGAAALYRREMLEDVKIGVGEGEFLDEAMALYVTDADLAWRARWRGWESVYEPGAVAYHVRTYSPSARKRSSERLRRVQFRNRYLMMLKNETAGTFLRHLPAIAAFEVMALGHALLRERFLLRAYPEALRLAGEARRRRRLAPPRTASAADLVPFLRGLAPSP
jgi:GT2 family glycosyltransferase